MGARENTLELENEISNLQYALSLKRNTLENLYKNCKHKNIKDRDGFQYCLDCGHYNKNRNWVKYLL